MAFISNIRLKFIILLFYPIYLYLKKNEFSQFNLFIDFLELLPFIYSGKKEMFCKILYTHITYIYSR